MRIAGLGVASVGLGGVLAACGDDPTAAPNLTTSGLSTTGTGVVNPTTNPVSRSSGGVATTKAASTTAVAVSGLKPDEVATNFLKTWENGNYDGMYDLLSASAVNFIAREKFVTRYKNIADEATLSALQTKITSLPALSNGNQPYEIPFTANFKTARAGEFSQKNTLSLVNENKSWLVDWRPANIFTGLNSVNLVRMFPANPPRGDILDRNNQPLAHAGVQYAVFVVPGKIANEDQLLNTLSQSLTMDKTKIKDLYKSGQPDWRMDIKRLPGNTPQTTLDTLLALAGVGVDQEEVRAYPNAASAAHVVGYVNGVNQDDLATLAAKGYREEDVIGRTGVEAWGEDILAGAKGGKLTIIQPDGTVVEKMSEKAVVAGNKVTLNLDLKIQQMAEKILADKVGSIIVMNPADGAVLALASFPSFDPNLFVQGLTTEQFKALNDDPRHPFQPRPYGGLLPVGSTFKVITMSAALERLGIKSDTMFTCTGHWTGLGEQFAKDCYVKTGHGNISLYQGLVQSCDVVFYELGKRLDEADSNLLPAIAKGFGLGSSTGLVGLKDAPGQVPDAQWKKDKIGQPWVRGDAVNLGIGQGYLLATPLQMAAAYAGIANGGPIPVPRLAARSDGPTKPQIFAPAVKQSLPVSPANLAIVRSALQDVVISGTGRQAFAGSRVKVAGKTGTAESGKETPHAWFCCYAPADKPKYVVVIALEEGGYGNEKAAPLARQLIDQLPF